MHITIGGTYTAIKTDDEYEVGVIEDTVTHTLNEDTWSKYKKLPFPFTQFQCSLRSNDTIYILTGLLMPVMAALKEAAIQYRGKRDYISLDVDEPVVSDFLRDHQKLMVTTGLKHKRGILKAATGAGKTFTIAEIAWNIWNKGGKVLITVPTRALLYQFEKEFSAYENLSGNLFPQIGMVGDGKVELDCDITLAIPNTFASNLKKVIGTDAEKSHLMVQYLESVTALLSDECLTGDSLIQTESGLMPIKESNLVGQKVLSFNESKQCLEFKPVTRHLVQGKKSVLRLTSKTYDIRCTKNHLLMTQEGWKEAQTITTKDYFVTVALDVNLKTWLKQVNTKGDKSTDVKIAESNLSGPNWKDTNTTLQPQDHLQNGNILNYVIQLKDLFTEHYWEIALSIFLMNVQEVLDWYSIMENRKENGQSTKLQDLLILKSIVLRLLTKVMETSQYLEEAILIQSCLLSITSLLLIKKSKLQNNGLTLSLTKVLLGGIWTMEVFPILGLLQLSNLVQKDSLLERINLYLNGLAPKGLKTKLVPIKTNTALFDLMLNIAENGLKSLESMQSIVCCTNLEKVNSIKQIETEELVYDLEVKDNHNFIANGILVHNCHTTANSTYSIMLHYAKNRVFSLGWSATPWVESGCENIMIGAFSEQICDISEQDMMDKDVIMSPVIVYKKAPQAFAPPNLLRKDYSNKIYHILYDYLIVKNQGRNALIAGCVNWLVEQQKGPVITIVKKIDKALVSHGEIIRENLLTHGIDQPLLHGGLSKKERERIFQALADETITGAIAGPSILKLGVDIPNLYGLVLGAAGSSSSDVIQRVGRVLRQGRSRPVVVDFLDPISFFKGQSYKRMRAMIEAYGEENLTVEK